MTTRGVGLSEEEREARETLLAAIKWRLDHYGPRDAEPFQLSRFESEAHAALDAVVEAGWVPAAHTADLAAQVARAPDVLRDQFCDCPGHGLADDQHAPDGCAGLAIANALRAALSPAQPDTERGGGS